MTTERWSIRELISVTICDSRCTSPDSIWRHRCRKLKNIAQSGLQDWHTCLLRLPPLVKLEMGRAPLQRMKDSSCRKRRMCVMCVSHQTRHFGSRRKPILEMCSDKMFYDGVYLWCICGVESKAYRQCLHNNVKQYSKHCSRHSPFVAGLHGFPALLLPQLGRDRHHQEEVLAHKGPLSGVQHEGEKEGGHFRESPTLCLDSDSNIYER